MHIHSTAHIGAVRHLDKFGRTLPIFPLPRINYSAALFADLYDRVGLRWPAVVAAGIAWGFFCGIAAAQNGWFI